MLDTTEGFEIIKANDQQIIYKEEPSALLKEFVEFCGPKRIYQLFYSKGYMDKKNRLATWHEQLIREFKNKKGHELEIEKDAFLQFLEPIEAVYELA